MKWFILLVLSSLIAFAFLNKEKLPFLNKEAPIKDALRDTDEKDTENELNTTDPNSPKETQTPKNDPIDERYPIPNFKPIEELVGNWKSIPASAFPRVVTLRVKAKYVFAGGAGSSTVPAGRKTTAISLSGEKLVITPNKQAKVRGTVLIDDTDYKDILGAEYAKYQERKTKEVLAQRERARAIAKADTQSNQGVSSPSASRSTQITSISRIPEDKLSDYENEIGSMPEAETDGQIQIMARSIQSRDVSEIKLNEISYWGPIRYEIVDNQAYWTATVNYKTTSLFGTFPTEAMALMRNGQVENWLYTGSLEEVP